jgi:hypothetical protein
MAAKNITIDLGADKDDILIGVAGIHGKPNSTPEEAEESVKDTLRQMFMDWAVTYYSQKSAQEIRTRLVKSLFPEKAKSTDDGRA